MALRNPLIPLTALLVASSCASPDATGADAGVASVDTGGSRDASPGDDAAISSDAHDADGAEDAEATTDAGLATTAACAIDYSAFNASTRVNAQSTYAWTCTDTTRQLTGNGIPDHPVETGSFATPVGPQNLSVSFPRQPALANQNTVRRRQPYGYALNAVKLDPETAATCTDRATSTMPGSGCVMVMGGDPWQVEAIGGAFRFGTDESNAHTQPNGQYHYHGMPEGMLAGRADLVTLVGFALDGFPIYARHGYSDSNDPRSPIKVMVSSWQLKATPDSGRPDIAVFPMGTFTQDFEYVPGSGDLDDCNGRTGVTPEFPNGTYHYYITDTYPFIQRCLKGTML